MKKASIVIMLIAVVVMIVSGIKYYYPVIDNVVDSAGSWAYMHGPMSVPWVLYSGGVIFLMGLTIFISTWEQKARRY